MSEFGEILLRLPMGRYAKLFACALLGTIVLAYRLVRQPDPPAAVAV